MRRFAHFIALLCLLATPLLWWLSGRFVPRETIPLGVRRGFHSGGFVGDLQLFYAYGDGQLDVFDVRTGVRVASHEADGQGIMCSGTLPAGIAVVALRRGYANAIEIREITSWRAALEIPVESGEQVLASFAPNGRWLATLHAHKTLRVWDLNTAGILKEIVLPQEAYSADWKDDSTTLVASIGGYLQCVTIESGRVTTQEPPPGLRFGPSAMTRDGRILSAAYTGSLGEYMVYDASNGREALRACLAPGHLRQEGGLYIRSYAPFRWLYGLKSLAAWPSLERYALDYQAVVQVYSTDDWNEIARVPVGSIGVSRNIKTLASYCERSRTIRLWDLPMRPTAPPALLWAVIAAGLLSTLIWWQAPATKVEGDCRRDGGPP